MVKGTFPSTPLIDDLYEADGEWINETRGWRFSASNIRIILPSDQIGIKDFLKKIVGGVGEKKAAAIVNTFGDDTLKVIAKDPKALMSVKGIGEEKSTEIHLRVIERTDFPVFAAAIQAVGSTMSTAVRAYQKYGVSALTFLQNNPYALIDIEGFGFKTADIIAYNNGMEVDNLHRLNASIRAFLMNEAIRHGHMFVYERDLFEGLARFLNGTGAFPLTSIDETKIKAAIEASSSIVSIYEDEQNLIYLQRLNFIENKIANQFSKAIQCDLPVIGDSKKLEQFLREYKVKIGMALADQQIKAVQMVSEASFSILTGGCFC